MNEPFETQDNMYSWETEIPTPDPTPTPTPPPPLPPKKAKKGWTAGKVVAIALVCSLLGGVIGAAGMLLLDLYEKEQTQQVQVNEENDDNIDKTTIMVGDRGNSVIDISKIDSSKVMTAAEVYAVNVNSTVGITTSITTNYWGYQSTSAAAGSGFIFSDDGYILTNFHVVEDSTTITVALYNGKTYDAKLIGYDESNDVAVLKIEAEDLVPVVLGNSDNVNVGDSVVAIGNPLGELTFSLTSGAISAKDRDITMSSGSTMRLMQTDCAINSGNSGGALFNMYGEVIGITNAKYSSNSSSEASIDNIGFAIPINKARSIAESIIEKGYVSKPYIGLSATTVSTETQSYGLPQGAAIKEVAADGPAAAAGLKVNDIITHINGKAITGSGDLVSIVGNCQVGDTLKCTVYRQGSTLELTITVGEKIQTSQQQQQQQQSNQSQTPQRPW